jgi:hypothetical protein
MYKLSQVFIGQTQPSSVLRLTDSAGIPFDPANTDYQQFKQDVLGGAELQDADGNTLSQTEAEAFIATLP